MIVIVYACAYVLVSVGACAHVDRSVEEMSVLQGRCNQQTVAMADLHRIMVEGICRASNQRRCRFVRTSAWNL
jgi:hypothetical protein